MESGSTGADAIPADLADCQDGGARGVGFVRINVNLRNDLADLCAEKARANWNLLASIFIQCNSAGDAPLPGAGTRFAAPGTPIGVAANYWLRLILNKNVISRTTVEHVNPGATLENVVSFAPDQDIVTGATDQDIVTGPAVSGQVDHAGLES